MWVVLAGGCRPAPQTEPPGSATQANPRSATEILEALEVKIERGAAVDDDREAAYEEAAGVPDDGTASYAFARAALAGRLAELRGLGAGALVTEAERFARLTLERDPEYDEGAATRMLGTLYVMAPGRLVEHGDSEDGLTMLENLAESRPGDPRNHLRLAEAFVFLGDLDEAAEPLCRAVAAAQALRADEQALLAGLVKEFGGEAELGCAQSS